MEFSGVNVILNFDSTPEPVENPGVDKQNRSVYIFNHNKTGG
jgi:hypothetical protein